MRQIAARLYCVLLPAGIVVAAASCACAQLATLDKGHRIIVDNGLQIWGAATDVLNYDVPYPALEAANMNAVIWGFPANGATAANGGTDIQVLSAGDKWGKWTDWQYNNNPANGPIVTPQNALTAAEQAHFADLIAVQVGDESNQSDMESGTQTRDWLLAAGNGTATTADDVFPNSLLYVNSFFIGNTAGYANFLVNGNPDAISWDSYPFANPHGHYITPRNWLALGNTFRRHGLGSYIGATNASPRPYGLYLQTYNDSFAVDPGEVEIRWQQFAAWTMGYKFVDAFIFSGGNNNFGNNPSGAVYINFQETARQGENLGPALSKLISYGYGPSFVQGAGTMGLPGEWLMFNRNNAPASQRYLTSITNITNLGTKNGGLSGDVYVGFFNPLHLSFGDPTDTAYFMVMNGLGGDLTLPNGQSDNTATVAETRQQMSLTFDFGVTGINSLQRLNRNTGLVEVIDTSYSDGGNTVLTSLGNGKYQLQLKLDGGTGDLFKYNDGTPFVGEQAALPLGYWDNDANAANNNVASGAGLGGAGNWDAASAKWYNGSTNSTYATNSNVVFAGTAGTVTLTAPRSATSLQFKTNGYTVAGSTLTLTASMIYTDAGVTATISSTIAGTHGLTKNGPGTLILAANNTYSGGTQINEGVLAIDTGGNNFTMAGTIGGGAITKIGAGTLTLSGTNLHSGTNINGGAVQITSDANLGAAPTSFTAGNITLDGGTLKFGGNLDIHNNRGITINVGDGTIDTQGFSNGAAGYNAFQGGFRGPGDLTKLGSGTFFAAATSGGANVSWKGRLIIQEGTWKIVASDGLPYNAPVADGLQPTQVTLDGGTWQIGATINVTNARRGVTVAAGGGTVDTQGFNLTWAGPWAGNDSNSVLNKIGNGQLRLNSSSFAGTYAGILNIDAGTLQLDGGTAMGNLASINLANTAGAGMAISTAAETIGSLSGGGATGGNVTLSVGLTAGGNNNSTTFAGVLSGAGGFTKAGTGVMTLAGANAYSGGTTVSGGTLAINGSITGSAVVQNGATLAGAGSVGGTITVHTGAHLSPGNSLGTLTTNGLAMMSGSFLHAEVDGTSDKVVVAGNLALNGTLDVSLLNGFAPVVGQSFTLMTAGAITGAFATESLPTFSFRTFDVVYNPQSILLKVVPVLPGDYNSNGAVDGPDYVIWRKGLGTVYTQTDYDVWRANFGQSAGPGASSGAAAVPEPAAWMLLCVVAAMLPLRIGRLSSRTRT